MQELNAWLQSEQDFNKGVELYNQFGTNSFFKELLKAGPTLYNVSKLRAELQQLAPAPPASPAPEQKEVPAPTAPEPSPAPAPVISRDITLREAKDHAHYLRLCDQRDTVVKQLDRNMALLSFSTARDVLHQTAKQILRLYQQKTELWAKIDYFQVNNSFKVDPEPEPVPIEIQRQLIYQSISKARARLKDPNYTARARTEKLIQQKLKELEALRGGEK